jgi:hypothetical protein
MAGIRVSMTILCDLASSFRDFKSAADYYKTGHPGPFDNKDDMAISLARFAEAKPAQKTLILDSARLPSSTNVLGKHWTMRRQLIDLTHVLRRSVESNKRLILSTNKE